MTPDCHIVRHTGDGRDGHYELGVYRAVRFLRAHSFGNYDVSPRYLLGKAETGAELWLTSTEALFCVPPEFCSQRIILVY